MSFYLYRFFEGETLLYIGKGSGSRFARQKRRFNAEGEIFARFDDEDAAYEEERRLIQLHRPLLNIDAGGRGGRAGLQNGREMPSGFSPEGLALAAPHLARLLVAWKSDNRLGGILGVLGAYVKAHGLDNIEAAVVPHLKRLLRGNLAIENSP